jgi:hypothetical protein
VTQFLKQRIEEDGEWSSECVETIAYTAGCDITVEELSNDETRGNTTRIRPMNTSPR